MYSEIQPRCCQAWCNLTRPFPKMWALPYQSFCGVTKCSCVLPLSLPGYGLRNFEVFKLMCFIFCFFLKQMLRFCRNRPPCHTHCYEHWLYKKKCVNFIFHFFTLPCSFGLAFRGFPLSEILNLLQFCMLGCQRLCPRFNSNLATGPYLGQLFQSFSPRCCVDFQSDRHLLL